MKSFIFPILVCLLLIVPSGCIPQVTNSETNMSTSGEERAQAIRIAKSVFSTMNDSIAIGPIVDQEFLTDFADRLLAYERSRAEEYVDPSVAVVLSPSEFKRFFIAATELFLIGSMYSVEQLDSKTERLKLVYPPGVFDELMKDAQLRKALKYDLPIKTKALFDIQLDSTERAVAKGRKYLSRRSSTSREKYVSSLNRLNERQRDTRGELFEPSVKYYTERHFGFPAGTRFIWIDVPVFRLELVESQGSLRVIDIGPYVE